MRNIAKFLLVSFLFFILTLNATNKPPYDSIKLIKSKSSTYIYLFQNVNFSLNEIKIEENCKSQLFLILKYLKENPNLIIEIGVHNNFYTKEDLSQIRADVLKDFFISYGIKEYRIRAVGYNIKKYINNCLYYRKCTEKQKRENRRIQFKIVNPEILTKYVVVQK